MTLIRCNNGAFARGLRSKAGPWRVSALHEDRPMSGVRRHTPDRMWRSPTLHVDRARLAAQAAALEEEAVFDEDTVQTAGDDIVEDTPKRSRAKRRYWLLPLVFLAVIASTLWVLRYPIIENYARNKLAAQGIEADLSLSLLSKNRAVIKDIRLASEDATFLTAQNVDLAYNWREALKLKLRRIQVEKPALTVEVNGQGDIISDWMPESQETGTSSFIFPQDGIEINDGRLTIESPFGDYEATIDAQTRSEKDMSISIVADPQKLSYQSLNTIVGGQVTATLLDDRISYEADLDIPELEYEQFSGSGLTANWQAGHHTGRHYTKSDLDRKRPV